MTLVLDTSAVSRVMHRVPRALEWIGRYDPGRLFLSSPVAAEIHVGLELLPARSRRRALLRLEYDRLRSAIRWLDWNEPAAIEFGRRKADLHRRGALIEDMDLAIGSIAIVAGARLAACNAAHFRGLSGLAVEDWDEAP